MNANENMSDLIREYVVRRVEPAISVSQAAGAIRKLLPELDVTARELDNAIAARALAEGYAVIFDRSPESM
jgi:hypothetical protein